jgi:hypothetical protein
MDNDVALFLGQAEQSPPAQDKVQDVPGAQVCMQSPPAHVIEQVAPALQV